VWLGLVRRGSTGLYELDAKQRGEAKERERERGERRDLLLCILCRSLSTSSFYTIIVIETSIDKLHTTSRKVTFKNNSKEKQGERTRGV
jgi:hypothetical protein